MCNLAPATRGARLFDLASVHLIREVDARAGLIVGAVRAVAQLGRAPASGAGGRGFESRQPDSTRTARHNPFLSGNYWRLACAN